MRKMTRAGALILGALLINGCAFYRADRIHYTVDPVAGSDTITPSQNRHGPIVFDGDVVIGLALSGGGARASVYGMAAIEALSQAGVMEQITHISSVSGGGFPAAYYALKKPQACPQGGQCQTDDFSDFRNVMRHNFLADLTRRQIGNPNRITSPTRRLSSLQDALDDKMINEASFGDLPPSPILLINGARYDDGRRFVFSTQAIAEEPSTIEPFTEETLRSASFSLPGCPRATPNDFSVALAIAISAGFPPLLGPAAIEGQEDCNGPLNRYWHLGDGGILDNTGVETLEDFALHAGARKPEHVIIFSMDAGRSTSSETMMRQRNLKLWTSDPGRVVDIVGKRANAYRNVVHYNDLEKSGVTFTMLNMRYTDADLREWPASCGKDIRSSTDIASHLAMIPTNFKITDCDADLMEMAAHHLVQKILAENNETLREAGLRLP